MQPLCTGDRKPCQTGPDPNDRQRPAHDLLSDRGAHPARRADAGSAAPGRREPPFLCQRAVRHAEAGIPVENYSDGEDAPAKLLPWLERDKPLGIDKNWPARFLLRLMELDAAPAYRNASAASDDARAVKDAAEQEAMRASSKVNDDCMAEFGLSSAPASPKKRWPKPSGASMRPMAVPGSAFPHLRFWRSCGRTLTTTTTDDPAGGGPVRPDRCGRRVSGLLFRYDPDVLYRGAQRGGAQGL